MNSLRPIFFAAALLLAGVTSVQAFDSRSSSPVNVDVKGVALRGFDPVSYFGKGPQKGDADYTQSYAGATYYFANKDNLAKFKANPEQYAPQFGGFCALAVAKEKKADADPQAWRIVDGKLYLTENTQVQKEWQINVSGNLKVATETWKIIKTVKPSGL